MKPSNNDFKLEVNNTFKFLEFFKFTNKNIYNNIF